MIASEILGKWNKKYTFYNEARLFGLKLKQIRESRVDSLIARKNKAEEQIIIIDEAAEKVKHNIAMFNERMKERASQVALIQLMDLEIEKDKEFKFGEFVKLFSEGEEFIQLSKKKYSIFDRANSEKLKLALMYYYNGNVFPLRKTVLKIINKYVVDHSFLNEKGKKEKIVKILKTIDNPYIYGILGEVISDFLSVKVDYLKLTKLN